MMTKKALIEHEIRQNELLLESPIFENCEDELKEIKDQIATWEAIKRDVEELEQIKGNTKRCEGCKERDEKNQCCGRFSYFINTEAMEIKNYFLLEKMMMEWKINAFVIYAKAVFEAQACVSYVDNRKARVIFHVDKRHNKDTYFEVPKYIYDIVKKEALKNGKDDK